MQTLEYSTADTTWDPTSSDYSWDSTSLNACNLTSSPPSSPTSPTTPTLQPFLEQVANALNVYVYALIVFGVAGNTLSALVFLRRPLRSRSSSFFLASLAIVDLLYLVHLALVHIDDGSLFHVNGGCQVSAYLSNVFTFLSIWLIVGFTAERFIAVQYPLHRPHVCTVRRAKCCIGGLVLVALVCNAYLLVVAGMKPEVIQDDGDDVINQSLRRCDTRTLVRATPPQEELVYICDVLDEYQDFYNVINTLDTLVTLLIPLALIVIMNILIIAQLQACSIAQLGAPPRHLMPTDRRSIQLKRTSAQLGRKVERKSVIACAISRVSGFASHDTYGIMHNECRLSAPTALAHSNVLYQRAQRHITKMLLLISTVFIALNLPSYVTRLYLLWFPVQPDSCVPLVQSYAMFLFYTNFAINFLLYSVYGRTFRKALVSLMCDCCGRRIMSSTS